MLDRMKSKNLKRKLAFFKRLLPWRRWVLWRFLWNKKFYEKKYDSTRDQNILTEEQPCSYAVGDWALVTYDGYGQSYPGEITEVHESILQIQVMERAGGKLKWPKKENKIYYAMEFVCKSLSHPIVAGNREQYKFTDLWTASVESFKIL